MMMAECDVPVPGIPVPGNSSFFLMVSEPESKKFGTEKSLGTGLEKILVPKKVSEPVSKNFGTEKSLGIGLEKVWYRKKISEPVSKFFRILVLIWVPVSSRSRDFCNFFMVSEPVSKKNWYRKKSRNRSRRILVPKKVSESVSKKFGTEKKSRNRYRSDFGSRHTLLYLALPCSNLPQTATDWLKCLCI